MIVPFTFLPIGFFLSFYSEITPTHTAISVSYILPITSLWGLIKVYIIIYGGKKVCIIIIIIITLFLFKSLASLNKR